VAREHRFRSTIRTRAPRSARADPAPTLAAPPRFTFAGDDDLWVFINRKLAINLGGIHQTERDTVNLDEKSAELDISKGNVYPFNLFFAERHTVDWHFHVQTSIAEFNACE
jgi:fibro-slime domain-containing protein